MCPGDCENDRYLEIEIWPPKPEILICLDYMTDKFEIPAANLRALTTANSMKMCSSNYDNDRHPEMEYQLLWR